MTDIPMFFICPFILYFALIFNFPNMKKNIKDDNTVKKISKKIKAGAFVLMAVPVSMTTSMFLDKSYEVVFIIIPLIAMCYFLYLFMYVLDQFK